MDIPLHAEVHCADRVCGETTHVILNPKNKKVTHIVIQPSGFPSTERLVPINTIINADHDKVFLRLTSDELNRQMPFTVADFLPGTEPMADYPTNGYLTWPANAPETQIALEEQQNPPGTLAVSRGARIMATDGYVGKADDFLVDPTDDQVTHLIIREGVLWGKKDITIPISEVDRIEEDTVYLKLGKKAISDLPATPAR